MEETRIFLEVMDVSTLCRIRRRFPSPVFWRHYKCTWRQTSMKCSKTLNNFEFRIYYLTCILCLLILRRLVNKKTDWTDWISEALQPEFGDVKLSQRRFNFHRTCQMFPSKYHLQYYEAPCITCVHRCLAPLKLPLWRSPWRPMWSSFFWVMVASSQKRTCF